MSNSIDISRQKEQKRLHEELHDSEAFVGEQRREDDCPMEEQHFASMDERSQNADAKNRSVKGQGSINFESLQIYFSAFSSTLNFEKNWPVLTIVESYTTFKTINTGQIFKIQSSTESGEINIFIFFVQLEDPEISALRLQAQRMGHSPMALLKVCSFSTKEAEKAPKPFTCITFFIYSSFFLPHKQV